MAKNETEVVNAIMVDSSPFGARLFRNVRGGAYPVASVKPLLGAILRGDWATVKLLARSLRMIMMGLQAPGASDLVGGIPLIITPEMVGKKIAVFTVIEVKTSTGSVSPEQRHFIEFVQEIGGYAGVARSPEDARKIMKINLDVRHNMP